MSDPATPLRPRPEPSELTAEFWRAAAGGRLVRPVCTACQRSHFTPQVACPHCLSTDWRYLDSVGVGTVYSHTTVHRPPVPGFRPPYVLAIVDVDADANGDGWDLLTNIVGCQPAEVHIGQRVAVRFEPIDGEIALPTFAPISGGAHRKEVPA